MNRKITENGQIVDGKVNINTSAIFSRLIQEAARWCEDYASDIIYDIDNVRKALEGDIDSWGSLYSDGTASEEGKWTSIRFRFGFRQYGVDHGTFIGSHFKQGGNKEYYRAIWRLIITADFTKSMATATLERIDE